MKKDKILSKFNQIKHLTEFRDLKDSEIMQKAEGFVKRDDEIFDLINKFSDLKERKLAKNLLVRYLQDFSNITVSDKNILKDLIYYEVVQIRLQTKLNVLHDKDGAVPSNLMDNLRANSEMILSLKTSLNLLNKDQKSGYDVIEILKKRFKAWREENQATRTLCCPYCGKMIMLKIRTEAWEAQKHPFFKDRILYNKHLIELYKNNKVTKEDLSLIFECSPDYVDWVINKIEHKKEEIL